MVDELSDSNFIASDLLTYGIYITKGGKRIDPREFLSRDNFDEELEAVRKQVGNELVRKYAERWADLLPRRRKGKK